MCRTAPRVRRMPGKMMTGVCLAPWVAGQRWSDSRHLGQLIGRVESSMSRSPHEGPCAVDVEPLARQTLYSAAFVHTVNG